MAGPGDIFSTEVPHLLKEHFEHLRQSGISVDVIRERDYESILGMAKLKEIGFARLQQRKGLLIPLHGVDGDIVGYQLRPDHPREQVREGKVRKIKYETPRGASIRFDVPPRCQPQLGNPKVDLFFTEGAKKADALATAGACAINLTGVWGFRGKNPLGGRTKLADFQGVAFNGRRVYLAFDSDSATNPQVRLAMETLAGIVAQKGAIVGRIVFPAGKDGSKVGADDYLADNHTLADLVALAGAAATQQPHQKPRQFAALFKVEDGQLVWAKADGGSLPLADFSAKIAQIIVKDNGLQQDKFFKIIGRDETGNAFPEVVEVPVDEFDSLGWITKYWDVRGVISSEQSAKSKIRQAILVNSRDADRKHVYTHTGWTMIDGKPVFLTAAGAIGAPNISVELPEEVGDYYLPNLDGAVESNDEALRASLDFLDIGEHKVLLPLWASMYLSPLTSFLDPSFTLFLVGLSGTFKSGITGLALNHFGPNFNYNRLPASWTSTENAIEKLMFDLKDLPLVVDDYAPAQDVARARDLEVKVERIVRAQAFRQGRIRLTKTIAINQTYRPRGFLVTSGEHLPSGHSHVSRMFVVETKRGDLDQKRLFAAVDRKELLSSAMAQFIQWAIFNWERLHRELPAKTREWRNEAMLSDDHPRLPNAVAQLQAGLVTGLEFMVDRGIITRARARAMRSEAWDTFMAWSAEQSARVEAERPAVLFMRLFETMMASGIFHFGNLADTEFKPPQPGQVNAGWMDEAGNLYLNATAVYTAVRQYGNKSDVPLTVKEDAVWRDCKEKGITQCADDRTRFRLRVNNRLVWVVKILKTRLSPDGHVDGELPLEKPKVQGSET